MVPDRHTHSTPIPGTTSLKTYIEDLPFCLLIFFINKTLTD